MGAKSSKCFEGVMGKQQPAAGSVKGIVGSRPIVCNMPFTKPHHCAEAEKFKAQPGDIMIVTYPKCGTTWCQQLCHQLRTGGHTDFDEISEEGIVPWIEVNPSLGIDNDAKQIAEPRCFKTHQMLSALSRFEAKGVRYLCVFRDPEATMLSFFKFRLTKGMDPWKDVNEFAKSYFVHGGQAQTFGGNLWEFYAEFWKCRMLPNVRIIVFEDLKRDLEGQVLSIADFMGLPEPSKELRAKVLELGSFGWMAKNDHLFDDHHVARRLGKGKGKGKGMTTKKVGLQVGDDVNVVVTEETRELLAQAWRDIMTPVTGHSSYQDMIKDLRNPVKDPQ